MLVQHGYTTYPQNLAGFIQRHQSCSPEKLATLVVYAAKEALIQNLIPSANCNELHLC